MPLANEQNIFGYNIVQPQSVPPWLQGPLGTAWFEMHGIMKDVATDASRHAILARFVEKAPDDALPVIASERMLEQMPSESNATWVHRLQQAFSAWEFAGTAVGIVNNLLLTGYSSNISVLTFWSSGVGGTADKWASFLVLIGKPNPWGAAETYNGVSIGGRGLAAWGDTATFGSNAPIDQVERVLRQVRNWKAAHAHCVAVRVMFTGSNWGSSPQWGRSGFTWGGTFVDWHP